MFGYVAPLKSELKIREFEVYNAYYCAACHAVKRRYGELPRLLLSYDAAFIAMLAAGLLKEELPAFRTFRCMNNPFKKRNAAAASAAIDYAADVMVLLGWLSLKDGKEDRDAPNPFKNAATSIGEAALRRAGRRAAENLGQKAAICLECLEQQKILEAAKEESLDRAADPTGRLMAVFLDFTEVRGLAVCAETDTLRSIGYHIGRYIYIMDAAEDLKRDRESGAYNPLVLRPETKESLKAAVSLDLARLGELIGELKLIHHGDIIENIVYLGLHAKLDDVLGRFDT